MSSTAGQYFANSQFYQHNPQFYTPMVNVPTLNRLPSHGELVSSVELLIAHVTKITSRLDRIESRVNDWVNLGLADRMLIAEKGINALKVCHNENDTKIASTNIEIDYAFDAIKCANERMVDSEKAIDRIADIMTEHESKLRHAKQRSRDNSKKCAEIGVLRRRISKVEDFNTEFAECFETPSNLRGIVTQVNNQVEECDKTLTYMVKYGFEQHSTYDTLNYSNFCEGYNGEYEGLGAFDESSNLDALNNVHDFFASYDDENDERDERDRHEECVNGVESANNTMEAFQCSPAMASCDGMYGVGERRIEQDAEEDEDEDFEKI
jgi:hypothetical protein